MNQVYDYEQTQVDRPMAFQQMNDSDERNNSGSGGGSIETLP